MALTPTPDDLPRRARPVQRRGDNDREPPARRPASSAGPVLALAGLALVGLVVAAFLLLQPRAPERAAARAESEAGGKGITGVVEDREIVPASGLYSVAVEGHELHASLRPPRLDSVRDLPPGVGPANNPRRSSDDEFVQAIAHRSSQGRLGREGVRSALYALYAAGDKEVGVYGLEVKSGAAADRREEALRGIWAFNGHLDRARVHRNGLVLVVVWHSGVSSECWEAVNAGIAGRLGAP